MHVHRPTSIVVGPDWENHRRSLSFRIARLLDSGTQLVRGTPAEVAAELLNMCAAARKHIGLLVLPYVLHDFAHDGFDVSQFLNDLADAFPQAAVLATDYTFADDQTDEDVLAGMTTDIERTRMGVMGRDHFLAEHRAFTPERFNKIFQPFPYTQTVRFGTRTVLHASQYPLAGGPLMHKLFKATPPAAGVATMA